MSATVRVGMIGAGSWGLNHVRVLASEPACTLAWVAEPDERQWARVQQLAPHARCVTSADDVLAEVDACVIASPASTHADLAVRALDAGKHVLVEKPMARSLADAQRIARAARPGAVVMVGHQMLFHPVVLEMRKLLAHGSLGAIHYVEATRAGLGRLRADETALWCFGPHDLSMLDFLVAERPSTVSAVGRAVLQPGVEDIVFVSLRYPSGLVASLHLSWLSPRKTRRLVLACANKLVEFDDVSPEKLRVHDKLRERAPTFTQFGEFLTIRDGDQHILHVEMEEPLRSEIRHFLDCIQDGNPPRSDVLSGLRVTAVLDAAQRSLGSGGIPLAIEDEKVLSAHEPSGPT